ncbi:hypothetical protein DIPPA_10503 [Diplonema papillatum]|nr:hypothetical protein DIPPA_10503 [Diplonema papillatum]
MNEGPLFSDSALAALLARDGRCRVNVNGDMPSTPSGAERRLRDQIAASGRTPRTPPTRPHAREHSRPADPFILAQEQNAFWPPSTSKGSGDPAPDSSAAGLAPGILEFSRGLGPSGVSAGADHPPRRPAETWGLASGCPPSRDSFAERESGVLRDFSSSTLCAGRPHLPHALRPSLLSPPTPEAASKSASSSRPPPVNCDPLAPSAPLSPLVITADHRAADAARSHSTPRLGLLGTSAQQPAASPLSPVVDAASHRVCGAAGARPFPHRGPADPSAAPHWPSPGGDARLGITPGGRLPFDPVAAPRAPVPPYHTQQQPSAKGCTRSSSTCLPLRLDHHPAGESWTGGLAPFPLDGHRSRAPEAPWPAGSDVPSRAEQLRILQHGKLPFPLHTASTWEPARRDLADPRVDLRVAKPGGVGTPAWPPTSPGGKQRQHCGSSVDGVINDNFGSCLPPAGGCGSSAGDSASEAAHPKPDAWRGGSGQGPAPTSLSNPALSVHAAGDGRSVQSTPCAAAAPHARGHLTLYPAREQTPASPLHAAGGPERAVAQCARGTSFPVCGPGDEGQEKSVAPQHVDGMLESTSSTVAVDHAETQGPLDPDGLEQPPHDEVTDDLNSTVPRLRQEPATQAPEPTAEGPPQRGQPHFGEMRDGAPAAAARSRSAASLGDEERAGSGAFDIAGHLAAVKESIAHAESEKESWKDTAEVWKAAFGEQTRAHAEAAQEEVRRRIELAELIGREDAGTDPLPALKPGDSNQQQPCPPAADDRHPALTLLNWTHLERQLLRAQADVATLRKRVALSANTESRTEAAEAALRAAEASLQQAREAFSQQSQKHEQDMRAALAENERLCLVLNNEYVPREELENVSKNLAEARMAAEDAARSFGDREACLLEDLGACRAAARAAEEQGKAREDHFRDLLERAGGEAEHLGGVIDAIERDGSVASQALYDGQQPAVLALTHQVRELEARTAGLLKDKQTLEALADSTEAERHAAQQKLGETTRLLDKTRAGLAEALPYKIASLGQAEQIAQLAQELSSTREQLSATLSEKESLEATVAKKGGSGGSTGKDKAGEAPFSAEDVREAGAVARRQALAEAGELVARQQAAIAEQNRKLAAQHDEVRRLRDALRTFCSPRTAGAASGEPRCWASAGQAPSSLEQPLSSLPRHLTSGTRSASLGVVHVLHEAFASSTFSNRKSLRNA